MLKSVTTCNKTANPIFYYTVNLAFMDYFYSFWEYGKLSQIPLKPTIEETILPIAMEDFSKDPYFKVYTKDLTNQPHNLQELSQLTYQKKLFQQNRKKLFPEEKAEVETPLSKSHSKNSFLFTAIFHIYTMVGSTIAILWAIPYILVAIKQRKMKSLVAAMAMHNMQAIEAASLSAEQGTAGLLTALDNPSNHATKLVCQDPWVSFILTIITIIGLVMYLYKHFKHFTLIKGHRFASICHIHLVLSGTTRYVPLKIGQHIGSPFLFKYNHLPQIDQIKLNRQCLWDNVHIRWGEEKVTYKDQTMSLRSHLNVPLIDKIRLRNIFSNNHKTMFMIKQGDTWYNLQQC